jgi:DNA-binding CsgD family transcriptional regulator
MTWRQIALDLEIAPGTVRGHLTRARERLEAENTTHAVVLAIARREIDLETILEEDNDGES